MHITLNAKPDPESRLLPMSVLMYNKPLQQCKRYIFLWYPLASPWFCIRLQNVGTVYTVHCTLHSTQYIALHSTLHSTHYTVHCTLHSTQYTALHTVHSTLHSTHYTVHCTTLYTLRSTVYTLPYTTLNTLVYTLRSTVFSMHSTLHRTWTMCHVTLIKCVICVIFRK